MRVVYTTVPGLQVVDWKSVSGTQKWSSTYVNKKWATRFADTKARSPRPKGFKYPKPYFASYRTLFGPYGSLLYNDYSTPGYEGRGVGFARVPDLLDTSYYAVYESSLEQEALTQAYLDLADTKVEFGAALAEASETAAMIEQHALQIWRLYKNARSGRWQQVSSQLGSIVGKPRDLPRTLAARWLWFNWGVLPLVSDVDAAIQQLLSNEPWRAWISSKGKAEMALPRETISIGSGSSAEYVEVHLNASLSARTKLWAQPDGSYWRSLNSLSINPVPAAWEATFMSAVADWFLPIGDWLNSLNATAGLNFMAGCTSMRLEVNGEIRGGDVSSYGGWQRTQTAYKGSFKDVSLTRVVYDRFPSNRPAYFKQPFPGGGGAILKRAATAVSLLVSFVHSNPPNFSGR